MKNKMLAKPVLTAILLMTAFLTACSSDEESSTNIEAADIQAQEVILAENDEDLDNNSVSDEDADKKISEKIAETIIQEDILPETEENAAADDYDREYIIAVYRQALTRLYEEQIFPEEKEAEYNAEIYDISENQFAVYDVDLDGRDELVLLYVTSWSMAGMAGCVYDYDESTDSFYLELIDYPRFRFYDNQVVEADWSHSQGYGGDFYPYSLYIYDNESDTYQSSVYADAWDLKLAEADAKGNPFPYEADTNGDGVVYYVMQSGEYEYHDPIDWDEYEAWHSSTVGNEMELPYMYLTPENIDSIK